MTDILPSQRRPFELRVEEDSGLAGLIGGGKATLAREAALREPAILQTIKDVLRESFASDTRRHFLDPFAPAQARNTEVLTVLRAAVAQHRQRTGVLAQVPTDDETLLALFAATVGWGPGQRYLDDPSVNEIKLVGARIRVQESGKPFVTVDEQFQSVDQVLDRALLLASVLGVKLDAEYPQQTLPLSFGNRMHVTIPPRVTRENTLVCIRRGRSSAWDLSDLVQRRSMDPAIQELLTLFSRARCSFLIAGRTGSGKTALLEALANSWPGDPHIITIEDQTAEINIRRTDLWTREYVNVQHDPQAYGRVAKEAMRQTPDLLCPGETRGPEAGAILAMVLSDHPVMTTLHARSCLEAVQRFASFAAMPGAYMYENRRDEALRDTCGGFDVVVKMDVWEDIGVRLITEVALLDGFEVVQGVTTPVLRTIAAVDVTDTGRIVWSLWAKVGAGGMLQWSEEDQTPSSIREKLVRARALAQIRTTATSLDVVVDAITRAQRHLLASEPERALATLRVAWNQRHDGRLIVSAQQAINQSPGRFAALYEEAQQQTALLQQLMRERRWNDACQVFDALMIDLATAAIGVPIGGWEPVEDQIKAGLGQVTDAEEARIEAELALRQGHARTAVDILSRFTLSELPLASARALVHVREQAMEHLVAAGQGSEAALLAVQAQREALTHTELLSHNE